MPTRRNRARQVEPRHGVHTRLTVSIFDHPDTVSPAPSWRCPSCRTLQPETTHCWRCQKAAYACETCALFRASVAAGLGYCASDPARAPLRSDETRSCWEAASSPAIVAAVPSSGEGLFAELGPAQPPVSVAAPSVSRLTPSLRRAPDSARRVASPKPPRAPKPPLEEPGRAAWVEPDHGLLVDAPEVEPGKRNASELERREPRRWRG